MAKKQTITQSAPKSVDSTVNSTVKSKVKVLYQNLGGVWYAFADVNDSIFVGKVNVSAVEKKVAPVAKKRKAEKQAA